MSHPHFEDAASALRRFVRRQVPRTSVHAVTRGAAVVIDIGDLNPPCAHMLFNRLSAALDECAVGYVTGGRLEVRAPVDVFINRFMPAAIS